MTIKSLESQSKTTSGAIGESKHATTAAKGFFLQAPSNDCSKFLLGELEIM